MNTLTPTPMYVHIHTHIHIHIFLKPQTHLMMSEALATMKVIHEPDSTWCVGVVDVSYMCERPLACAICTIHAHTSIYINLRTPAIAASSVAKTIKG